MRFWLQIFEPAGIVGQVTDYQLWRLRDLPGQQALASFTAQPHTRSVEVSAQPAAPAQARFAAAASSPQKPQSSLPVASPPPLPIRPPEHPVTHASAGSAHATPPAYRADDGGAELVEGSGRQATDAGMQEPDVDQETATGHKLQSGRPPARQERVLTSVMSDRPADSPAPAPALSPVSCMSTVTLCMPWEPLHVLARCCVGNWPQPLICSACQCNAPGQLKVDASWSSMLLHALGSSGSSILEVYQHRPAWCRRQGQQTRQRKRWLPGPGRRAMCCAARRRPRTTTRTSWTPTSAPPGCTSSAPGRLASRRWPPAWGRLPPLRPRMPPPSYAFSAGAASSSADEQPRVRMLCAAAPQACLLPWHHMQPHYTY